jgi:hypothetical protein
MRSKTIISLQEEEVRKILAELEFIVVSLDRLGSASLSDEARRAEVYDFVMEGDVFRRLSAVRALMWRRVEESVSRKALIALEDEFEKIDRWKLRR